MSVDLKRAIDDWEYRESVVELDDPLVTLLERAGVYDYDDYEWVPGSNWNGPAVTAEPGALKRAAIRPDPTLSFDELRPMLDLGPRARVVIAKHPSTPLEHLHAFAEDEDSEVQLAVFSGARWADELLALLARSRFPVVRGRAAVHAHLPPSLVELLLMDPEDHVRVSAAQRKEHDAAALTRIFERDPARGREVASHENVTAALLLKIARTADAATREVIAWSKNAPTEALDLIAAQPNERRTKYALAVNPATSSEVLVRLLSEEEFVSQPAAAELARRKERAGIDLDRALVDHEYRESIASKTDPLVTFLERAGLYAYDEHDTVEYTDWNGARVGSGPGSITRSATAPDPTLPFSALEPLMKKGPEGRKLIAKHPSTPYATLLALAKKQDENHEVHLALLAQERCDEAILAALCRSNSPPVRDATSKHPRLPFALYETLLDDPSPTVSVYLRKDLDAEKLALILERYPKRAYAVAEHANVTPELLRKLATHESQFVREVVAANPLTPADALAALAKADRTERIQWSLIAHQATPAELLVELATTRPDLRERLAKRDELPREAQLICAYDPQYKVQWELAKHATDPEVLDLLFTSPDHTTRRGVAENRHFKSAEKLASDVMAPVRRAVAERTDVPRAVLEQLAQDAQSEVSRAATKTLEKLHLAASGEAKKE